MARRGRPTRGRGGRGAAQQVEEVVPLEFDEPERPSRMPRGGGRSSGGGIGSYIGIMVPMAVTLVAVIIIVVGGFLIAGKGAAGMSEVMDRTGVNSAIALSVVEPEWWDSTHGLKKGLLDAFKEKRDKRKKDARKDPDWDERDDTVINNEFDEVVKEWDLAADTVEAEADQFIIDKNERRLEVLVDRAKMPGSTILYAKIIRSGGPATSRSAPNLRTIASRRIGNVEVVKVLATIEGIGTIPARAFKAPVKNMYEQEAGHVLVLLDERPLLAAGGGMTMMVLVSTLLGLLLVGGVAFGLCLGASKGVMRIASDLDQVARGDLDVRIKTGGPGEVSNVARAADRAMKTFRAVQEQTVAAAAAPVAVVESDEGMDTEGLLPSEPPRFDGYEIEAVHKGTAEGANDFYDFIQIDNNHLGVVIADMPHPGAKGAFAASTFRALMRAYAPGETSPAKVLSQVNRVMAGELKRGDHITAMYTVLDVEKGIAAVASAGHLPLIFWKLAKKGSALLNPEGIAIGLDKGPVFEKTVVDKRIKLEKGDRFVLYTDGPLAAANAEGEEFGEQRFYYLVSREAPKNSAAFVNFVANEVDLFHEGAPQQDDITLVTVRRL